MEPTLEASTRRMSKQLPESSDIPLCVDLDATLVKTDLLWEGVFLLLKENWCALLCLPLWWWKGIAQVKYEIARRTWPDFELLPYRSDVLELIHQAHADGRHVVLVSAAHELLASKVARHLDLFHEVIATRGLLNLKGEQKRLALEERFGRKRFDYVGNDRADLPVWAAARRAYVVTNNRRLLRRAEAVACISSIKAGTSVLRAQARGMRLHQWSKNILVFVPIITAHQIAHPRILAKGVVAFFAFGLVSSSVYLVNDLLDLQADRAHKIKRVRPFAAGDVSAAHGFMLASLLLVLGLTLSIVAGVPLVGALLAGYFAMSFVYSCFLKRVVILDVLLLAGFYTLRIFAGGAATRIAVSGWLLAFSMFFFFGLALVKRC
ncbi:MAG: UbiA family prenyltransferase, partial [Acidobacteriota bacterium]|nr:UbiA family prenyltransferase [Acidobacteriota bacterium]